MPRMLTDLDDFEYELACCATHSGNLILGLQLGWLVWFLVAFDEVPRGIHGTGQNVN